jgi:RhoGAP domain/PH domain
MEGILEKKKSRGFLRGGWQKRYFRLSGTSLTYSDKHNGKVKETLDLFETLDVGDNNSYDPQSCSFFLETTERRYDFRAASPALRTIWLDHLMIFHEAKLRPNQSFAIASCVKHAFMIAIDFLFTRGTQTEGIFRISVNSHMLDEYVQMFLRGEFNESTATSEDEVHAVAGVVKRILRDMPETLLTERLLPHFVELSEKTTSSSAAADAGIVSAVRRQVLLLPSDNMQMLHRLCMLLHAVADMKQFSQMDIKNLAICIGPNLTSKQHNQLIDFEPLFHIMLENMDKVFGRGRTSSAVETHANSMTADSNGAVDPTAHTDGTTDDAKTESAGVHLSAAWGHGDIEESAGSQQVRAEAGRSVASEVTPIQEFGDNVAHEESSAIMEARNRRQQELERRQEQQQNADTYGGHVEEHGGGDHEAAIFDFAHDVLFLNDENDAGGLDIDADDLLEDADDDSQLASYQVRTEDDQDKKGPAEEHPEPNSVQYTEPVEAEAKAEPEQHHRELQDPVQSDSASDSEMQMSGFDPEEFGLDFDDESDLDAEEDNPVKEQQENASENLPTASGDVNVQYAEDALVAQVQPSHTLEDEVNADDVEFNSQDIQDSQDVQDDQDDQYAQDDEEDLAWTSDDELDEEVGDSQVLAQAAAVATVVTPASEPELFGLIEDDSSPDDSMDKLSIPTAAAAADGDDDTLGLDDFSFGVELGDVDMDVHAGVAADVVTILKNNDPLDGVSDSESEDFSFHFENVDDGEVEEQESSRPAIAESSVNAIETQIVSTDQHDNSNDTASANDHDQIEYSEHDDGDDSNQFELDIDVIEQDEDIVEQNQCNEEDMAKDDHHASHFDANTPESEHAPEHEAVFESELESECENEVDQVDSEPEVDGDESRIEISAAEEEEEEQEEVEVEEEFNELEFEPELGQLTEQLQDDSDDPLVLDSVEDKPQEKEDDDDDDDDDDDEEDEEEDASAAMESELDQSSSPSIVADVSLKQVEELEQSLYESESHSHELEQRLENAEKEAASAKERLQHAVSRESELTETVEQLSQQLQQNQSTSQSQHEQVTSDIVAFESRINALSQELQHSREEAAETIAQLRTQVQGAAERQAQLQLEAEKATQRATELEQHCQSIQLENEQLKQQLAVAQQQVANAKDDSEQVLVKRESTSELCSQLSSIIESHLGRTRSSLNAIAARAQARFEDAKRRASVLSTGMPNTY